RLARWLPTGSGNLPASVGKMTEASPADPTDPTDPTDAATSATPAGPDAATPADPAISADSGSDPTEPIDPARPGGLAIAASSSGTPPWLIAPQQLKRRQDCRGLRARTAAQVPGLIRRRKLPPGGRVVRVGAELGGALAGWYLVDRRQSRRVARPELSR